MGELGRTPGVVSTPRLADRKDDQLRRPLLPFAVEHVSPGVHSCVSGVLPFGARLLELRRNGGDARASTGFVGRLAAHGT